jgi:itaconyl-CoA hydratase
MVAEAVKVGDKRFRESYGRYFEDFTVGDIYEHRPGRTITEADNTWFTLLTMNQHPLHFDREYARHTEFGEPIVNSALTLAVVTGMSVSDVSQKAIANLGWTDIVMPAPVFNGDTRSRPTQGIVTIATRAYKADGTLVMSFKRTMLIPRRGHAVEDKILGIEQPEI